VIARRRGPAESRCGILHASAVTSIRGRVPKLLSAELRCRLTSVTSPASHRPNLAKGLWLEFAEPIEDKRDRGIFGAGHGLRSGPAVVRPDHAGLLPLANCKLVGWRAPGSREIAGLPAEEITGASRIRAEPIRTIFPTRAADNPGLDDMEELKPALDCDGHFLLRCPRALIPTRGTVRILTYEIRVGHKDIVGTAQGRWGRRLR